MPALPVHHSPTSTASWDGGAQTKALDTSNPVSVWKWMYAWVDKGAVDSGADGGDKEDYAFPHHMVSGGKPAAANVKACQSAIGILNGGMGGSRVPDSDRQGVFRHLAAHLKDAGVTPPDLNSRPTVDMLREARAALVNVREERLCAPAVCGDFQMRSVPDGTGGESLVFTGYPSVTGKDYTAADSQGEFTERIMPGAFKRSLDTNCDVAFLLNHSGPTLARTRAQTLILHEDSTGLGCEARLDPRNPIVQIIRSGVERGDLSEMSFAFRVPKDRQVWSDDWMDRTILECNLNQGDVSVVNFGANPHTGGLVGIRSPGQLHIERLAREVADLYEFREGKPLSESDMARLQRVLAFEPEADNEETVDSFLADIMGVDITSSRGVPSIVAEIVATAPGLFATLDETKAKLNGAPTAFEAALLVQRSREIERKYRRKSA